MKKFLLALSLVFFTGSYTVQAQITIDSSDYGSIGDTVLLGIDSMPVAISVGNSGANQVWDFSTLVIDSYDTLKFLNPAVTTYGSNYPASNLAVENSSETSYIIKSDSELIMDGIYLKEFAGAPINFAENYEDNQRIMNFPSSYLSTFSDFAYLDTTFRDPQFGATIDSARLKRTIIVTSDFDAWGVVTSPAGTDSCLRQNRIEITIDSVWIKIFGVWNWFSPILPLTNVPNPDFDTSYVFSWWAKGKDFPFVELRTNNTADTVKVATFIIGNNIVAFISNQTSSSCNGICDGQATASAISGTLPYSFQWDSNAGSQTSATATGLCAGNYSVSVIDATGDTSITTVMITEPVPLILTVTITSNATCGICNNGSATAVANGGSGNYAYTWSDGYIGATNGSMVPGFYSVLVTDGNSCTAQVDSVFIDSVQIPVGIEEFFVQIQKFTVYPNPVYGLLFISNSSNGIIVFELKDVTGRVIGERNIERNGNSSISVSGTACGLYFYRISDLDGSTLQFGKVSVIR